MFGCGPMTGGHRGPMNGRPGRGFGPGPRPRMGYVPGMGFRPMRVHRRPMGFFPVGGLFILPALMFGGWIAVAVLGGLLSLAGTVIGGVLEEVGLLAEGVFSGSGLVIGMVIGLVAFYYFRNKKKEEAARQDHIGTVDGVEVEQIIEPEKVYRTHF